MQFKTLAAASTMGLASSLFAFRVWTLTSPRTVFTVLDVYLPAAMSPQYDGVVLENRFPEPGRSEITVQSEGA